MKMNLNPKSNLKLKTQNHAKRFSRKGAEARFDLGKYHIFLIVENQRNERL